MMPIDIDEYTPRRERRYADRVGHRRHPRLAVRTAT